MQRVYYFIVIAVIIPVIFSVTSCMTSRGTLFDDVVSADTNDTMADNPTETPGLTVRTSPARSDVYINNNFAGAAPVTKLLSTGTYRITVEREGYYPETKWINYTENDSITVDIDLEAITGILQIRTTHPEIKISSGGENLSPGNNELQIGRHHITAELFGYETWQEDVNITEDKITDVVINLKPAGFRFSSLFIDRKTFNPDNSAGLGESRIFFEVTNYGTGELEIFSPEGKRVLSHRFPSFTEKDQKFIWNGKDNYGNKLPDGTYRIVISGKDIVGNNTSIEKALITIDSTLIIRIRNINNGVSGTLFCPTPDVFPTGSFQLALEGFGHIDAETGNYRFPVILGVRTTPVKDLEISGQVGVFIQKPLAESYIFSVSAKKALLSSGYYKPIGLSWTMKGTYLYNTYQDSQSNFTGLSTGLSTSVNIGPLSFVLGPEITVSPYKVSYTGTPGPGFYIWGYAKAAFILDLGPTMIGFSTSLRSNTFDQGFSLDYPFSTGVELHWLIPGTGIFISGIVSGEFNSADNYYINAGGGVGIIN